MGTSEVRFPEGENLIGLCCSDELHFFSLFVRDGSYSFTTSWVFVALRGVFVISEI